MFPEVPGTTAATGRSSEATPLATTYPLPASDQAALVVSIETEKVCVPSGVRTNVPDGTRAAIVGVIRENVALPVALTAGSRVNVKSAIQLSRSAPVLVAARVARSTCRMSHCIHRP